ncbi:uncharacterized protein PV09_00560 [Verruconis gallopava]|uniref:Uncharacterized protein n=1 Tax=Verruconis gallopava TaxID=253628 RepID=A0A0D2AQ29_9PEZI|nr:uncharacterized protein PV09_00560 [Verruconis gallopava]KIW08600.1 hypothetical protein PV09_00560 [Verruconis gallopava]
MQCSIDKNVRTDILRIGKVQARIGGGSGSDPETVALQRDKIHEALNVGAIPQVHVWFTNEGAWTQAISDQPRQVTKRAWAAATKSTRGIIRDIKAEDGA